MKLSDFKQKLYSKKISFVDGSMSVAEEKSALNGEINFYELDADRINSIYEGVIKGKENIEDMSNETFIFTLMPYICDIEIDVDGDEFEKMMENPNAELIQLMSFFMSSLKDILSILNTFGNMSDDIDDMKSDLKVDKVEETKEDKLKKLYYDLAITTNVDNIKVILSEIKKLEAND